MSVACSIVLLCSPVAHAKARTGDRPSPSGYTHLTLVVDRSGSMEGFKASAERGINSLLESQRSLSGKFTMTLVQFDDQIETVYRTSRSLPNYTLIPRGGTALLDAVGEEILRTDHDVNALSDAEQPDKVLFVVVTDGEENSSEKFTSARVKDLIAQHRIKDRWDFRFIGTEEAAWQGADMAMDSTEIGSSDSDNEQMYSQLTRAVSDVRLGFTSRLTMPQRIVTGGAALPWQPPSMGEHSGDRIAELNEGSPETQQRTRVGAS